MANRRVVLDKLVTEKDGDNIGQGEVFLDFTVNGISVIRIERTNPMKVKSGQTYWLQNRDIIINKLEGKDTITVEGFIAEKDNGPLNSDEMFNFRITFNRNSGWGIGPRSIPFQDGKVFKGVLYYRIEDF